MGQEDVKPLVLLYNSCIVHSSVIKASYYGVPDLVLDYSLKLIL
jgi:hypothetical protein